MRITSLVLGIAFALPCVLAAQQPTPDTTKRDTVKPAPPAATVSMPVDFSGVIYANYQYRGDQGAPNPNNKFDLERVYLTFRMPAGDRASIRVTTDVFQQTGTGADAFYRGWVIRAKYAYLQYDLLKSAYWNANIRAGILHTVVIDHIEQFWPRWISQTAVERAGFFSSADAGVATLWTLPNKWGELYATIVNGPGYTSREVDRFKDYAARLSLTPLSNSDNKVLRTFALTGWTYIGAVASTFVSGGVGQIGPIGSSMPRNRSGVFLGLRDPRFTLGGEWDTRKDGRDAGLNTIASPRTEFDSTGTLLSGFVTMKPFQLFTQSTLPLGLVARWDRFKPNGDTDADINTVIAGLTWDINKKVAFSFDYQEATPHDGAIFTPTKTYFMHLVANF